MGEELDRQTIRDRLLASLVRLLVAVLALAIGWLLVELLARAVLGSPLRSQERLMVLSTPSWRSDGRAVHYAQSETIRLIALYGDVIEYEVEFETNDMGYVDHRDYLPRTRVPTADRYAVIGDSFTAGFHGGEPWLPRLRDDLGAAGRDIEIYNLGTGGLGFQQFTPGIARGRRSGGSGARSYFGLSGPGIPAIIGGAPVWRAAMSRSVACLLLLVLVSFACSSEPPPEAVPQAEPEAEVPEFVKWTEEESEALLSNAKPGWLVLTVRDSATGEPITDCHYYGMKFAFEKRRVEPRSHIEVDSFKAHFSEDGVYRYQFASGWHQLRLEADDHWRTWTPVFRVEEGKETKLTVELHANVRLKVTVFDADGSPLESGDVTVRMNTLLGSVHIENGVGELWIEDDEVTLSVGKIHMKDYAEQSITMKLTPNIVNEATIRLTR